MKTREDELKDRPATEKGVFEAPEEKSDAERKDAEGRAAKSAAKSAPVGKGEGDSPKKPAGGGADGEKAGAKGRSAAPDGADGNKAEAENNDDKKGCTLGKFRNPEELLRAYGELEREFTRRSQKLAEAERALKEREAPFDPSVGEWKEEVDKFFANTPAAKPFASDIAREIVKNPELKGDRNCLYNALVRVLASRFRTPEQMVSDGEFLKKYVLESPAVKEAVVESYLQGLRDGRPPAVMGRGGQPTVTPKRVVKSISEAGALFLKDTEKE